MALNSYIEIIVIEEEKIIVQTGHGTVMSHH